MIPIMRAEPLPGRCLWLMPLSGQTVERDISGLMWGPVFERVVVSDDASAEVVAHPNRSPR